MDVKSINQVTLCGILGINPQIDSPQPGIKVANFSLGTIQGWYNEFEQFQSETTWHRVVAFNAAAAFAQNMKKGDYVIIKGTLSYEKVGENKREAIIKTDSIIPLGSKEEIVKDNVTPVEN